VGQGAVTVPDDDRDLNWTWLVAGAAVVLVLASRRARFWLADKLIDLGIRMQTDDETREVDRTLSAWGRCARSGRRVNGRCTPREGRGG